MDGPAAGQAHGERLVIGISECDDASRPVLQALERLGHDRTLDTATGHRAGYLAVLVDRHGRARKARTGPVDVDDAGQGHLEALGPPTPKVRQYLFHSFAFTAADLLTIKSALGEPGAFKGTAGKHASQMLAIVNRRIQVAGGFHTLSGRFSGLSG